MGLLRRFSLLQPLARRDFALLWLGQGISVLGDQFYFVALPWLTLQLTGSGLTLGTVLMAAAVPRAAFMLLGGALSDRVSPRGLMVASNVSRAILIALLTTLMLQERLEIWHLYVLAVAFGTVDAFFYPAFRAMLPRLVEERQLESGNAMLQGTAQLAMLAGPAPAGLLIATAGLSPVFVVGAAAFSLSAVILWFMKDGQKPAGGQTEGGDSLFGEIRAGLRYAWSDPVIRAMLLIIAAIDFCFVGSIEVGLPWLAENKFPQGAVALGGMLSAWGGGALLGTVIAGSVGRPSRMGYMMLLVSAVDGVGLALIGYAPDAWTAGTVLAFMGVTSGLINVLGVTWLQVRTDPRMIGRVMSLVMFASLGLTPISLTLAGALIDVDVRTMFMAAGAIILLATAFSARNPVMRQAGWEVHRAAASPS